MKFKICFVVCVFFNFLLSHSQVTIGEVKKVEIKIVNKPETYDSTETLKDLLYQSEAGSDFKRLIGLIVYLPPVGFPEVENKYYTIFNILFKDEAYSIWRKFYTSNFHKIYYDSNSNADLAYHCPDIIYVLKNESTNDTILSSGIEDFILTPFFVKQKKLYEGQVLLLNNDIYDTYFDLNTGERLKINKGDKWICKEVTLLKLYDGIDPPNPKQISDHYNMFFVLENSKGNRIVTNYNSGIRRYTTVYDQGVKRKQKARPSFVTLKEFQELQDNKRLKNEEILAKQRLEENKAKIAKEMQKEEFIKKYGKEFGLLISDGKVKIDMTKEMCKDSWGTPLWFDKRTTEYDVLETWYYFFGMKLYFVNDILKQIDE